MSTRFNLSLKDSYIPKSDSQLAEQTSRNMHEILSHRDQYAERLQDLLSIAYDNVRYIADMIQEEIY